MKRSTVVVLVASALVVVLLVIASATGASREAPTASVEAGVAGAAPLRSAMAPQEESERDDPARPMMKKPAGSFMALDGRGAPPTAAFAPPPPPPPEKPAEPEPDTSKNRGREGEQAAFTRAWFPETFLFEPLVVTDESGRATVPVRVPDRLTNWRVLALAHSRAGGQAGAVTRFAGTLPVYVDPVVPPFLTAGDEVRLPVQVVNTTDSEVSRPLALEAAGATLSASGGPVRVAPAGTHVQMVALKTERPGRIAIKATLGDVDAVERTIDVKPSGRPVSVTKGGTLAAPRTLTLSGAPDSIRDSERVRLMVFPGALALLRSELSGSLARAGVAEDAYSLLLAGRAASLLHALGGQPDTDGIRTLSIVSGQRALRHARAPNVATAALLAEAALAHPDNPVLARLGERMAATVASKQRPDGTCQGEDGWTLQRLMVTTADCVRAVKAAQATLAAKQRATAVALKASGAFERNLSRIDDGYTAAAVLASGAVSGQIAHRLAAKVLESIQPRDDGSKVLKVEPGVVRADGSAPTEIEATALAVLALTGREGAPLADLGATLLSSYHPSSGWGDGYTNLVCIRAVTQLFKEPVPPNVKVTLSMDGRPVAEGVLDPSKLKDVLTLEAPAPGSAGPHAWLVSAEPAVAGLGFSLTLSSYVPWKTEPATGGLDLAIALPPRASVGQPVDVTLNATAPAGMALELRHALPAGVVPDRASLDALVNAGTVTRYETEDGAVTLEVPPRAPGQPFTATYRVVPTLAGKLHAPASSVSPAGRPDLLRYAAPAEWTIQ